MPFVRDLQYIQDENGQEIPLIVFCLDALSAKHDKPDNVNIKNKHDGVSKMRHDIKPILPDRC